MRKIKSAIEIRPNETARLEAFSDGVFSIAITLLVLELIQKLHPQNGEHLLPYFLHHWEPIVSYIIGFLTILICWINHHHAFIYIDKTDSRLPWVNGLVLFMVTLTPFPTAIVSEYLDEEGAIALGFFGFNFFMMSIASHWICSYTYKRHLVNEGKRVFFYYIKQTYLYSIPYTLFAFIVCFISIPVAIVLYVGLFTTFAFPREFAIILLKRGRRKR
ncbi:TMEM175 family protein [Flavihumibacter fluvii]|uniref:TMEM175 family protein n=1 Tax=Flavihumibacter fluvii TaxID=2838157 RepID=UPI001BDEAE72|nr:TMEM175 family protein [Flavihumibacter fluvii]ULQ50922.1 DUF1211 domain-containing protein [Flavihumibacter fluvii]